MTTKIDRRARKGSNRGFTLLELGIVIGVAAILAAAIVPDLIETMRNRMAEKAAADVALLHDAARLFYVQNQVRPGRWPGENFAADCSVNFEYGRAINDLVNGGYIATGSGAAAPMVGVADPKFNKNPWGQFYEMVVYAPNVLGNAPACLFGIATNVPQTISQGFTALLPMSSCNACPNTAIPGATAPPSGFVRCCSYVPKPGATNFGPCPLGQVVKRRPADSVLICETP